MGGGGGGPFAPHQISLGFILTRKFFGKCYPAKCCLCYIFTSNDMGTGD